MKLYNTLSQTLETFIPLNKKEVKMYVCGITPYDTTHLGHAFTYMAFDVLQRYLHFNNYKVTYVQNVTDIDDDILKRAKQVNQDWKTLGNFWTKKFLTDVTTLNIQMPTYYARATETIKTIIEIIQILQKKGFAYTNKGNVYFSVIKDNEYGKLSKYTKEQMITVSKERGANPDDPLKKDSLDFILWQKSQLSEPFWESPWGNGRPGWHIECSAMIYKYLDKNIDIHGGGNDLIYPHHESEIAQSEHYTEVKPFVKYWMHTGAVSFKGEKMSKSLGNLVMISDLLKTYSSNAIRFLLLSHHYRESWEFDEKMLKVADEKIKQIEQAIKRSNEISQNLSKEFIAAIDDDLDTPEALNILIRSAERENYHTLKAMTKILGFNL